MINSVEKTNLAYAYACAVKAHQGFAENHSCIKGATIVFELIQGIEWYFDRDQRGCGYIGYTEKPSTLDQDNPEYGFEVNWVEYEDENYIHVDADDGCGNRHIQLVFLKSEEIKSGE